MFLPIELIDEIALRMDPITTIYFDKCLSNNVKKQIYRKIDIQKLDRRSCFIPDIIFPYLSGGGRRQIARYIICNDAFIDKYADKLHWVSLIKYQTLSELCIDKYAKKYFNTKCWKTIARYQTSTFRCIWKYRDKLIPKIFDSSGNIADVYRNYVGILPWTTICISQK
jgi:hypothetical protein